MNLSFVRAVLFCAVDSFFDGCTVRWAEQIMTRPKLPYITMRTGDVQRTAFPVLDEDDRFYSAGTTLELNLYAKGRKVIYKDDATVNYENTSVEDLADLVNYLESDKITDRLAEHGISIFPISDIRNLSELENESKYRFRANVEFEVRFPMVANGPYGYSDRVPNSSGGGSESMGYAEEPIIEDVEIEEE